ncbi:MAG TPA: GlsB/YeaQ/YmgE family stress response membrane protein [Candidatus Cybelea sp.]|jgi:uncharacterized membrane protein YeaQ/YmgE (transglycosylase-associated protein family)|nr:GlsB/YeaQ/YmgE family stress response membrane protein [Candidatus Cybelea sp.]
MLTGWILIVVFGLIVGLVARWIIPGAAPGGCISDIIVGVLGALIGSWLYRLFGHVSPAQFEFSLPSFVCALIGAIVLLWLLRLVRGRPAA